MSGPVVADPFDLPDWIGAHDATWTALGSVGAARVEGLLTADDLGRPHEPVALAVVGADVAYPAAVLTEQLRHDAHQAWVHGEVLLVVGHGRYQLPVPGTALGADLLCEAVRRFARAVGAKPDRMTVALRL